MMRKISIWCAFLLAACGTPLHSTPPPTPELIRVAVSPSSWPLVDTLLTCGKAFPETVFTVDEMSTSFLDLDSTNLVFLIGSSPGNAFAVSVGEDSLVVIANQKNPITDISTEQLMNLYKGTITSWSGIGGSQLPVEVWDYPVGEDIRKIFHTAVLTDDELTSQALVAPDPQTMLDAVADAPAAIGYIPVEWLTRSTDSTGIKILGIDPALADLLKQPILALSSVEPEGVLKQVLSCMQASSK